MVTSDTAPMPVNIFVLKVYFFKNCNAFLKHIDLGICKYIKEYKLCKNEQHIYVFMFHCNIFYTNKNYYYCWYFYNNNDNNNNNNNIIDIYTHDCKKIYLFVY